jgi:Zn-dependent protease with chaperone function
MPDLDSILAPLLSAYLSVGLGVLTASSLRLWLQRAGGSLSIAQATWCAWLPVLALPTFIGVSLLPFARQEPHHPLHRAWHIWTETLTLSSSLHNILHLFNLLFLLLVGWGLLRTAVTLGRFYALIATLQKTPAQQEQWNGQSYALLDSPRALCFTAGAFFPKIYVSCGLLKHLTPAQSDAMLAHETAHLRRRDGLTGAILTLFYRLFPLPGGMRLVREWQYTAERACDAEAAQIVGSPCDVAEALVEVTRLVHHEAFFGITCFAAGADVEGRVSALLQREEKRPLPALFTGGVIACLVAFVLAETWVSHLVELFVHH